MNESYFYFHEKKYILYSFFKKAFFSGLDLAAKELGVVLNPAAAFTLKNHGQ